MTKVLTFKVAIEGLEDKIWREIEITDRRTVADLAYTILATYHSLAYHLYDIEYKNKFYDCWISIEDDHREVELVNAIITRLSDMNLNKTDKAIKNAKKFEKYQLDNGMVIGTVEANSNTEVYKIVEELLKKQTDEQ